MANPLDFLLDFLDFSLAITWAYFIVYVIMFLVASIICAIGVQKEAEPNASICKLIKSWGVSLWKKKKVYGELIPHFFDQATDFGVVVEFYIYYKSGDDIGINTQYLFYLSIAIILVHRVVSAVAVYNLTQKPMYAIYQMLDVLMIRCVYTNYKLGTTQPSNAQRYLQTMEAIFESAPQILISTAFLIKTSQTTISITVLVSLFTSLFSLSKRVSDDDKVMVKEDWQESTAGKIWKIPLPNLKYIIRVFCWRFLEISSRITLLVLCWVNLGGKSIFFLLAMEFCYLTVLAWGLGTIDIMGNIIYLMAASSKRKGYKWAVPMAYLFWFYRVLSSWVLLITVTIYAVSDIQYGSEILNNEGGQTRHAQTLVNTAGLILFIYCWVAMPIWQWVGAVIVFDYKNLASVGRDIETLLDYNKWDEVLELVSFGARFDPANMLQKIDRSGSVKPEAGSTQMVEIKKAHNCPGQHGLNEFVTEADGFGCDICRDKLKKGETLFGCRTCNYDVCSRCHSTGVSAVACEKGHQLEKKATGYSGGYVCNGCRATFSTTKIAWHCDACNYDLCDTCYNERKHSKSAKLEDLAQQKLADICRAQLQESNDSDTCAKTGKLCEWLCSCPMFLTVTGLILIGIGVYFFFSVGTSGWNFYITVGSISVAVLLILCGLCCACRICDRANNAMKNRKAMEMSVRRHKSEGGNINCPGHCGLVKFTTTHAGYGCDICKNKFNQGVTLWGCRNCNYDACTDCKPEFEEKEAEIDETDGIGTVTCQKKHPLFMQLRDEYQCNKCKSDYRNEKSWYCDKCNYDLCQGCFADIETFDQKKKRVIAWMSNRDVDDKPILWCGIVVWPLLIALAFFFGSDIAALIVNSKYECDIIGGSGYVFFNVSDFLQYGAIVHCSVLGILLCCVLCAAIGDGDKAGMCIIFNICCAFLFFIPWIVIGFLLHSEMDPSKVIDQQCVDTVYAWTIIKAIEFGGLPCLMCMFAVCISIYDGDMEDIGGKVGVACVVCCGGLCALGLLLGSDIAMLAIHAENDCESALIGTAQFFTPTQWIYGGGITHLAVLLITICCIRFLDDDMALGIGCLFCCCCLFFTTWSVFGVFLYADMDQSTPENKQCTDAVLSWTILKIVEFIALPACALCLAAWN